MSRKFLSAFRRGLKQIFRPYPGSEKYWQERYLSGGTSGPGSYNKLAQFKARVINNFVAEAGIRSIIEFGCGDGNQLRYADYPNYRGYDISQQAIEYCRKHFESDHSKSFDVLESYQNETADCTMSLDVIFHLTEDSVFADHMELLFSASTRYVVIYSSNHEAQQTFLGGAHMRQRKFTDWIEKNKPDWHLERFVPNDYPYDGNADEGSISDFYIFGK